MSETSNIPPAEILASSDHAPVVAAILAAGLSRRMGTRNKLLQEVDGAPMVRKVVEHALASRCDRVLVVLGHQAQEVRHALSGMRVEFIDNLSFQEGLAASVRAAAAATQPGEALLVCLGDMPRVTATVLNQLIDAYRGCPGKAAFQPQFAGRRGNPVLWGASYVALLATLQGDEGARSLLLDLGDAVAAVPVDSDAIFMDVDTPDALQAVRRENFPRP